MFSFFQAKAPEYVLTCIKNCRKIQAYFKQKGKTTTELSTSQDDPTEELVPKNVPAAADLETPTLDAILEPSNNKPKSVWGSHLNKSSAEIGKVGTFRRHKTESAISRGPSFSGLFSEASMSQPSQQTRFSLKKSGKTVARKSSAKSFFDTLGGGDLETSTLPSPPTEESSTKKFVDPLARFDPEISMGGGCLEDDNSDEIVFSAKFDPKPVGDKPADPAKKPVDPVKKPVKPVETGKRHALSVLSVLSSSQKPESRLSFSGIFPKATTPVKASFDDNDVVDKTSQEKTTKRKRVESESQNQSSSDENSPIRTISESKRSRTDLSIEKDLQKTSLNDPSEIAIPKNDIYAIGFEDADDDPRGFASAKTVRSFVAGKKSAQNKNTENYVKINLKKKNYVRGKKTMTGAKYRRQEWKRKEAEKTKKGANKKKVRFLSLIN